MSKQFSLNRARLVLLLIILLVIFIAPACRTSSGSGMEGFLQEQGGFPCFDWSAFTCVTLEVPLNHLTPDDGNTMEVTFAVLPAARPDLRKGIFVVATGGPGSSGIRSADYYTSGYDPSILDRFDIVFFDQRGMGFSGNLTCPQAAAAYYRPELPPTSHPAAYLKQVAQVFSEDCVHEMTNADLLTFLGTSQAMQDLEYFRQATGEEKVWLYGESYGSQLAQLYAEKYPDHLAGLILDGTVDMTLSGVEYYRQQAQGFNDILIGTIEACAEDPLCLLDASSFTGSFQIVQAYDSLLSRLAGSPEKYAFPLPGGGYEERLFTFSDLEFVAPSQLYGEGDRMLLMRAMIKWTRDGDIVPLARLLYLNLSLNPQTLAAIPDDSYSDAVYYAVECQDYGYPGNSPEEKANNYLAAADLITLPRFKSIIYGDLPCAYWPAAVSDPTRPAPTRAERVPVLILGATADPVTPIGNGMSVFQNLSNGFMITTNGGSHVTFGYGSPCPDGLVVDFLVNGRTPASRTTTCEGRMMDSYVPLAPERASAFASLPQALASFEIEMYYLPEVYYWGGYEFLAAGCPRGGIIQIDSSDEGMAIALSGCAFSAGFQLTGTGTYNLENDTLTLNVATSGAWICDRLSYIRAGEAIEIDGSCNGGPIQSETLWDTYKQWETWKEQHPLF